MEQLTCIFTSKRTVAFVVIFMTFVCCVQGQNTDFDNYKQKKLQELATYRNAKQKSLADYREKLNKEYADKSSDEYRKQLDFLTRSLESASREQEIANARLKDFETSAKGAETAGLSLGDIIKANLTSDLVLK